MDPLIKSQLLYQLSYAPADQGKPLNDQGALHSAQGGFVQPLTRLAAAAAADQVDLPRRSRGRRRADRLARRA